MMTALVALDAFGTDQTMTSSNNGAIGKTIHLKSGQQFAFSDLMYGLLLESGNDVALALAENYPGSYAAMVMAMNQKAVQLGMESTKFQNVSGIDQYRHETTVHDLAILAAQAMQQSIFREIVGTKEKDIISLDGSDSYHLENTNLLLGKLEGVIGIKTGWTALAGESLVTYVQRGGRKIILVVLGSQNRFGETTQLIEWAFGNHSYSFPSHIGSTAGK